MLYEKMSLVIMKTKGPIRLILPRVKTKSIPRDNEDRGGGYLLLASLFPFLATENWGLETIHIMMNTVINVNMHD